MAECTSAFRVPEASLRAQIGAVLGAWGFGPDAVAAGTAGLAYADLRGIHSHGIAMLPIYERWRSEGRFVAGASPSVVQENAVLTVGEELWVMGGFQNLTVTSEGGIATLTVNRPDKLNALDAKTIAELTAAVAELDADDAVGVVIVTGAGEKAFVAGADIGMLADQGVLEGTQNARAGQALTLAIEASKKPFLAAINGFALGGGLELALACDMRFAAETAKLGLPEVGLGIIPGYGGTQRLPRLVGMGLALELILTGDPVPAAEALRIGLVNKVFPTASLLVDVRAIAARIQSRGANALALAKQAARRGYAGTLADGLAIEADLFGLISSTAEMKEGLRAFLEKRKPSWLRKA